MRERRVVGGRAPPDAELSDAEVMTSLGFEGEHPEGRFFPDTYQYTLGMSDQDILRRAHEHLGALRRCQAGGDDVDGNVMSSPGVGEPFREIVDRGFRGSVCGQKV